MPFILHWKGKAWMIWVCENFQRSQISENPIQYKIYLLVTSWQRSKWETIYRADICEIFRWKKRLKSMRCVKSVAVDRGGWGDIEEGHGGTWGGYAPLNFLNNTSVPSSWAGVTSLCQKILFYKSYVMQTKLYWSIKMSENSWKVWILEILGGRVKKTRAI